MNPDKVIILLATYNGERYLKEQLNSLTTQSYKNIEIIALDDCSQDGTLKLLESNNLHLLKNENNMGAKKSFVKLLQYALEYSDARYFMFCDQDDVWDEDKVEKSMSAFKDMEKEYGNLPMLVHTDLEVVDENMKSLSSSFMKYQNINPFYNSFERLLMQNTITGCTMLINRELGKLGSSMPKEAMMHDWWIGLCASYFGKICFLEESTMKYRQHGLNEIGAKGFTLKYIVDKFFESDNKLMDDNIIQAKAFLDSFDNNIDKNSKKMLENFVHIKSKNYLQKRMFLVKNGLFKHGFIRNMGLFIKI